MNIEQRTLNIEHRMTMGSARVSRAVFGVPPKTSFPPRLVACVFHRPLINTGLQPVSYTHLTLPT
ncbi:MAG: hypothetical protein N3I86_05660, partial [Verrucomicrobiae bacterium]|nr:hypothetical protein [Verrucomicrobiae bacterium]